MNLLGELNELKLLEKVVLVGLVFLLSQPVELGEDAVQRNLRVQEFSFEELKTNLSFHNIKKIYLNANGAKNVKHYPIL